MGGVVGPEHGTGALEERKPITFEATNPHCQREIWVYEG
jgi:hypothetical protein